MIGCLVLASAWATISGGNDFAHVHATSGFPRQSLEAFATGNDINCAHIISHFSVKPDPVVKNIRAPVKKQSLGDRFLFWNLE